MRRALAVAAVLALAAGAACSVAYGQQAHADSGAAAATAYGVTLEQYAAGLATRTALLDMRSIKNPTPADYGVTVEMLNVAQSLALQDVDIARRRSEAAWQAGDDEALMAATQQVVRLDPQDTVAQLRLITRRIGMSQTAEERLAKYDAFINHKGRDGQMLDAAVRSRLALDAALLLKERGDDAGFVTRLKQACQLDSTNKDAAVLALSYFSERLNDPMGRLELISNLLMSDPLDARVHEQLRDELAAVGAYQGAKRFHGVAMAIYRVSGQDVTRLDLGSTVLSWRLDGVRGLLDRLNETLAQQRAAAERGAGGGAVLLRRPEDVRLNEAYEEVRLSAAIAAGRPNDIAASLQDMTRTLQARIDFLKDRLRRPAGMTQEQVDEGVRDAAQRLVLWQCLAAVLAPGSSPAAGGPLEGEAGASAPPPAAPVQPITVPPEARSPLVEAWVALRDKQYDRAAVLLDEAGESTWTELGRAVLLEMTVSDGEASRAFRRVGQMAPLTALGALADSMADTLGQRLGGPRALPTADVKRFEDFAATVPAWVDQMPLRPHSFQSMIAAPVSDAVKALEPAKIRVRLKNLSPIPLGVGAARSINTRLLFVPSLSTNRGGVAKLIEPEVFEIDRRLRLMPNEEFACELWPDVAMVGFALEQASFFPTQVRWRVVQGFEAQGDARRPGLGSVEAQIDRGILHQALPEAKLSGDELVARLEAAADADLPGLLVASRLKLLSGRDPALDRLVDTLARRYAGWGRAGRLAAVVSLPSAMTVAPMRELDRVVAMEKDPGVLIASVLTRSTAMDDAIMTAAGASTDPAVAKVVAGLRDRFARSEAPVDPGKVVEPVLPADAQPMAPAGVAPLPRPATPAAPAEPSK